MQLRVSVIVRRRSRLDSSFLGRQGVGRGHPTRLTSCLMRGEKLTDLKLGVFPDERVAAWKNVQCARVNPRSGTRNDTKEINGTFLPAATVRPRCNPLRSGELIPSVYLRRAAYQPTNHALFQSFLLQPTTSTPTLKERCTNQR